MGFMLVFLSIWCSFCMKFAHSYSPPGGSNGTEDRLALLAFKAHITHDPFHVLSSWNDSLPHCEWSGILCGGRRHPNRVRALHLESRGLVGSMAPEIGNLSFLRQIWLQNNSFHGEIPGEVSFLSRLRYLNLSINSFEGEIPSNISRCSNLIQLSLSGNNIVGRIPVQLFTLSKLELLGLRDNKLIGQIPPSFANLSSLEAFTIANSRISGSIPNTLGQMTRLGHIGFDQNKLSGTIPPTIYNLSSLYHLNFFANQLQGSLLPNLGFNLPNLRWLSIANNQFHGSIPISISNLSKLELLEAGDNNLSGKVIIHFGGLSQLTLLSLGLNHLGSGGDVDDDLSFITTLTNCSSLKALELQDNQFGGELPDSMANLSTQLWRLSLARNQIFGNIPSEMGNLVGLQHLGLSANLLEGSIPTSIGRLQILIQFGLDGNRLTGPIPSSLGNLTQLNLLYLADNHLHGKIPSSLGKCKNLLGLNLSNNSFHGIIPKEIFDLSMLVELHLSSNYFFGSLPSEVGGLRNLEMLDVSDNMLHGDIPGTLGSSTSLEYLYMEGNLFQGSIPFSLGSLRGLEELDLSSNNLTGLIPTYLGSFKFLQYLNLSFNQLEGEVPTKGVFGNLSAVSVVGNNKLCGGIPKFHLPICQTQKSKRDGRPHVFKLIVTIFGCAASLCLIFMTIFFIICWRRKERKESTAFFIRDCHFKISYAQLLEATNGFSSTNLIGVGHFGSMYRGILNDGETIVAVKILNIEQRGASRSFMAECEALRNIRHRNLVKILTCCSSEDFERNDFMALLYEFMTGGNLEQLLHLHANGVQNEQKHLNLVQRLNIAIDVATALDYLHHHCHMQIIHCDIKPSNILLDDNLIAHLADFGISRILSTTTGISQNQTNSIRIKGSVGYIPPEYGASADCSTYGDVYSYGILLLEMFTRKQPIDEMFKDNFNLHSWAKLALHEGVIAVVDPLLLPVEVATITVNITRTQRCMEDRVRECLHSIIRIGVTCSAESPWDRMDMKDIVKELHLIRDIYLGVRTQ